MQVTPWVLEAGSPAGQPSFPTGHTGWRWPGEREQLDSLPGAPSRGTALGTRHRR